MKSDATLLLIGAFKLVKALALVAAGVLALGWSQGNLVAHVRQIGLPPKYAEHALATLTTLDAHKLHALGIGSLVYALLFAIEGYGLVRRRVWGEYLTVVITTSFIPLEIYEIVEHGSAVKIGVLVVNVLIVGYLVWRLRRDEHWPFAVHHLG